jgi:S-adenosylmethionine synthetase
MINDGVNKLFKLRLYDIIKTLKLDQPIYYLTSFFGHYGRNDLDLP